MIVKVEMENMFYFRCCNFLPFKFSKMCYRMKHKVTDKKFMEIDQHGGKSAMKLRKKKVNECFCV